MSGIFMVIRRETNLYVQFGNSPHKRYMLRIHTKGHKEFTTAKSNFQKAFTLLKSDILKLQISCLYFEVVKCNSETKLNYLFQLMEAAPLYFLVLHFWQLLASSPFSPLTCLLLMRLQAPGNNQKSQRQTSTCGKCKPEQ